MAVRPINRETDLIEERSEFVDATSDGEWKPLVNERSTTERINPDTGIIEERGALLDGVV